MLAAADGIALVVAVLIAAVGSLSVAAGFWIVALLPVWIVLAKLHGLYDRDHRALRHLTADELGSIVTWATIGTALMTAALALTPVGAPGLDSAVLLWLSLIVLTPLARALARVLWRRWTEPASVLLLGSGPL